MLATRTNMVFGFLLIETSSRKAVPEVTSTFPGPLHNLLATGNGRLTFTSLLTQPSTLTCSSSTAGHFPGSDETYSTTASEQNCQAVFARPRRGKCNCCCGNKI